MGEGKTSAGQTREHRAFIGRDLRVMPTFAVRRSDIDVLAASFDGRSLPIARSIFLALVDVCSEGPEQVVTRRELADRAGVTPKALSDYLPQLQAAGLLVVTRRRNERGGDIPSIYSLVEPGSAMGATLAGDPRAGDPTSSSSTHNGREEEDEKGGHAERVLPPDIEADVVALLKAKRRVDGKLVTEDEMRKAAAALVAFNTAQGGADHGLGANLVKLVGRIRERPAWEAAKWVRLVESAWRLRWWEKTGSGRRPTPAVVFGNANVLEQVAMDAAAEAAGQPIADTPERRGRYSRTVEPE
jgi:hypothetical protein